MGPSRSYVTEAVVLRLTDCGEADRIVTLLTRDRGKVQAIAKGARRSKHRFGAALAPFGHGEATLREGRGGALPLLEGLYGARGFSRLPLELGRLSHGSYALELCRELCPLQEPEPEVLDLLLTLLGTLDALPLEARPPVLALRCFELRLLSAVGFGLALDRCAACGGDLPAGAVPFDRGRGGALCLPCHAAGSPGGAEPLHEEPRALLRHLATLSPDDPDIGALRPPQPVLAACRDLLLSVVRHHLGRNPHAVEFIAKMNLLQV